jgi:hypothetical protein
MLRCYITPYFISVLTEVCLALDSILNELSVVHTFISLLGYGAVYSYTCLPVFWRDVQFPAEDGVGIFL